MHVLSASDHGPLPSELSSLLSPPESVICFHPSCHSRLSDLCVKTDAPCPTGSNSNIAIRKLSDGKAGLVTIKRELILLVLS